MAIKTTTSLKCVTYRDERGFALLVSVIFMSVMLTFGLALSSLALKQQILASNAIESQYAFYAADAGLECALYGDQKQGLFAYPATDPGVGPVLSCDLGVPVFSNRISYTAAQWVSVMRLSLDVGKHCADVTVYKPSASSGTTWIFSQGYDVPCSVVAAPSGARFVSRGLNIHY